MVPLDEAKTQLRVLHDEDDGLIDAYSKSATRQAERMTGRQFLTQTYTLALSTFCTTVRGELLIPKPPLISVTSLKYYDSNNVQQTLVEDTDFRVLNPLDGPAKIVLIETDSDSMWPAVYSRQDAVELIYSCGYGSTPSDIPADLRQAVRLLVGHYWQNRDNSMRADRYQQADAAQRLLFSYSVEDLRVEAVM